nr:PucR family transcriptional regulator [Actinomycetota bacterium]
MSLAELPADLRRVLRPVVPRLSEEIVEAIGREVEEYRRPLEGPFGATVREGSQVALERFVDLIGEPAPEPPSGIYRGLGKAEFRLGRTLDSLLAAYRLGARIAWRRVSEACEAAGVEPRVVYRLGEAIFSYIDELSAESVEGYAEAQTAAAGELQQRRRQLVTLLTAEPPAEERAVRAAAQDAGWRVPE